MIFLRAIKREIGAPLAATVNPVRVCRMLDYYLFIGIIIK
jgi:hypothetical protein